MLSNFKPKIDINFDFQAETLDKNGNFRDSDKFSPTLQEYHRILWSKKLPNGQLFDLTKISDNRLYHKSKLGEFYVSSDWGVATMNGWQRTKAFITDVDPHEIEEFERLVITIGARIIWPSNKINNLPTINGARGMSYYIGDRLDLTLESLRRYYLDEPSPLSTTFNRYANFFSLFNDFKGYIDYFLMQDYVSDDYKQALVAPPYDGFKTSPIPTSKSQYVEYMNFSKGLINKRNARIQKYVDDL